MNRKISAIGALLLLLAGICVMVYPAFSDYVNRINGSYAIAALNAHLEQAEDGVIASQRHLAQVYNASLGTAEQDGVPAYSTVLDFGNGIMGYIQIPKIGVCLPVYHGADAAVLAKGVGHLPQTAFPVGGEGTHAVLTGHTGLPDAALFTELTALEAGDVFCIHILDERLVYQVDQICVVLPGESEALTAVPGRDLCTLVTCTPYGINSHRLLVRGTRVEPEAEAVVEPLFRETRDPAAMPPVLVAAGIAAAAIMTAVAVLALRKERG